MAAEIAGKPARSSGGGFQRLVLWLLIFCLLGVVWWLASERNERHFRLAADNGSLVVERGRFFPMGTSRIAADDAKYGKAYGPMQLPPGAKVGDVEYDDQGALDRALFDQLLPWARDAAKKNDVPGAQALLDRASLLPGLSAQQQAQLAGLRGDLAYSEARSQLSEAAKLVLSARRKLELVRDAAGDHALEAGPLALELGHVVDQLAAAAEGKSAPGPSSLPHPPAANPPLVSGPVAPAAPPGSPAGPAGATPPAAASPPAPKAAPSPAAPLPGK